MQNSFRPRASAGVVLAGASLIAITPVAGPSLDVQSRAVQLTSTGTPLNFADLLNPGVVTDQPYPITTPAELASDTATNLQDLQNQISNDPAPILEQLIANQATYSNDLATAAENANTDFTSAVQGLPDVLQQASTDFSSGDVYDGLFSPYSYLLTSVLDVNHDLLNGASLVAQGIVNSLDNLVNDSGDMMRQYITGLGDSAVPTWLSDLILAPLYGPNAAFAGFSGVSQDVVTAAHSGDYSTVLSDLANAPTTITDAFLNGYDVNSLAPPPTADIVSDAIRRMAELNPGYGFLTGAPRPEEKAQDLISAFYGNQGTIENLYEASVRIAGDLGAEPTRIADTANAPLTDLLGGAASTLGLSDLSTVFSDLSGIPFSLF
jgi:hypothetical protein